VQLNPERLKDLRLLLICCLIGTLLFLIDLSTYLWLSVSIAIVMGFTIRYSKIMLMHYFPKMPLPIQYAIASLFAITLCASIPAWLSAQFHIKTLNLALDAYINIMLITTVITILISYLYYRNEQSYLLQQALDKAALERSEQDKKLLETQLRLLQSQIEPHFLFNTLANIQALIAIEPKTASKMLSALTSLLRQSLTRTRDEWLTINQELKFNRAYLAIQQIRLGERLQTQFDITDQLSDTMLLPPMLLQPLIENAVVHGIEPLKNGGLLSLTIAVHNNKLQFTIYNDCQEHESHSHKGHNIGLQNIKDRLSQLYGDAAQFSFSYLENGVKVYMEVPINVTSLHSAHCG
jgi:sensor histidine kinase YesM